MLDTIRAGLLDYTLPYVLRIWPDAPGANAIQDRRVEDLTKSTLLIKMIDLLRECPGITVHELASSLDRSQRTVYRWLNQLAVHIHTPVYYRDGGYYLASNSDDGGINLTPEELLALRLSLKASPFVSGSPIGKHAFSAWVKIRDAASGDNVRTSLGLDATHVVGAGVTGAEPRSGVVEVVEKAVNDHHRLRIVYRSQKSGQVKEYSVDPYALAFRRNSWYMVGFCEEHGKVAQFKLVRFVGAVDTGVAFEVPADFSVEKHFHLSWEAWSGGETTTVRVRFSPAVAEMILESKRHPTQLTYPQADGSVIMQVTVSGVEEIAIWIMGYGKDAEVLEPMGLRQHILDHARAMVSTYTVPQAGSELLTPTHSRRIEKSPGN